MEDDNPLMGMYAAITRRTRNGKTILPEQGSTAAEALYGYTMGGAIASGESDTRGSITPGKWVDVAVLSADPLTLHPEHLPEIRVVMTFLAGNKVYQRS